MQKATLEAIEQEAWLAVRAAEDWAGSYKKDPKNLARLIKVENRLLGNLRRYFKGLPQRALQTLSWPEYQRQVVRAYDVVVDVNNEFAQTENQLLMQVVFNDVVIMTSIGVESGQFVYGVPTALSPASIEVLKAAHQLTDKLVEQITATTKKQIEDSVATSLKLGEDIQTAAKRLQKNVGSADVSAARATRIARTESVRSFSNGVITYGVNTGAKTKTWHTSANPCRICEPLDGQQVGINGVFETGVGELDGNPAHPNCRCGIELGY